MLLAVACRISSARFARSPANGSAKLHAPARMQVQLPKCSNSCSDGRSHICWPCSRSVRMNCGSWAKTDIATRTRALRSRQHHGIVLGAICCTCLRRQSYTSHAALCQVLNDESQLAIGRLLQWQAGAAELHPLRCQHICERSSHTDCSMPTSCSCCANLPDVV
jgi:hypothetical protein